MLRMIMTTPLLASAASLWGQSISLAPMAFGIHRTGGVTGRASYGPWLVSGAAMLIRFFDLERMPPQPFFS